MASNLTVKLPPEWQARLRQHADRADVTPHAFVRSTIIGRLRRLDMLVEARARPDAAAAARLAVLLDDVRTARDQGCATVTLPTAELERLLEVAVNLAAGAPCDAGIGT
jgi:predicted transcriptional regulator